MKNSTAVIMLSSLWGLVFRRNKFLNGSALPSEINDSIVMMKKVSKYRKIGEMMKTSGSMMQEFGIKYNDGMMISQGKDLRPLEQNICKMMPRNRQESGSMNKIMGNN